MEHLPGQDPPFSPLLFDDYAVRHDIAPPHGVLLHARRLLPQYGSQPLAFRPGGGPLKALSSLHTYIVPDFSTSPAVRTQRGPSYIMPFTSQTFETWRADRLSIWFLLEQCQERTSLFPPEAPGTRLIPPLRPLALRPAAGASRFATDGSASQSDPQVGWAVCTDTGLTSVGPLAARTILPAECFAALVALSLIDPNVSSAQLLTDNMSVFHLVRAGLRRSRPPLCVRRYPYAAALYNTARSLPVPLDVLHVNGSSFDLADQHPLQHDADQLARAGRTDSAESFPLIPRYLGLAATLRGPSGMPAADAHSALPGPHPRDPPSALQLRRRSPPLRRPYYEYPEHWEMLWLRLRHHVWCWQPATCPVCAVDDPSLAHLLFLCPQLPPDLESLLPCDHALERVAWYVAGYSAAPAAGTSWHCSPPLDLEPLARHASQRWALLCALHMPPLPPRMPEPTSPA